jgi:putative peptidoglycan lipid II flippase
VSDFNSLKDARLFRIGQLNCHEIASVSSKLLKSTAIVSLMTLVSRISGLVRDIIMANVLGSSALADAFFVAFRIPNFLRRIFAEGAFSQAFVPVFSELSERNTTEAKQFVAASFGLLGVVTLGLSALGVLYADALVTLLAPGFVDDPNKYAATVGALQIMFPYLFCISIVAMSAGVLNTMNRFAVPAVTPVMLNICLILAMWQLMPVMEPSSTALAVGVMIAGVLQLLIQLPALKTEGFLVMPTLDFRNSAVMRVARLMGPAVFSVSVAQINLLVNTFLASFLVTGSVTWLYYSDRLMEFPVGVFGIALATVVLPNLSKEHTSGSPQSFSDMLDWALRWVVVIAVPSTFALIMLAVPLLTTLFNYNQFTVADVQQSAFALQAFSIGICGFIFVKVLAPGFFARQDTRTPMKVAVVSVFVNIVMSIVLVGPLAHTGLALAISIAAWVNTLLLAGILIKSKIFMPKPGWLWFMLRVGIAVGAMCTVLWYFTAADQVWFERNLAERVWNVVGVVIAAVITYFGLLHVLGLRPQALLLKPSV